MNYIDLIFLAMLVLFGLLGYRRGLVKEVADLVVLLVAFGVATITFADLSKVIISMTSIPETFIRAGAFFLIWFLVEIVLYVAALILIGRIDVEVLRAKWNLWGGLALGVVKGAVLLALVLATFLMLPLGNDVLGELRASFIGKSVENNGTKLEGVFATTFGEAASVLSKFATVTSGSNEKVDLGYKVANPVLDRSSALAMLTQLNLERKRAGLREIILDPVLSKVAEAHAKDMFTRGYLSHVDLEGKTPFDRMKAAGISFFFAGENLALAADTETAMFGLLESAGHRANILSGDYGKVGIAVLDGGVRGKIFVQEFTD